MMNRLGDLLLLGEGLKRDKTRRFNDLYYGVVLKEWVFLKNANTVPRKELLFLAEVDVVVDVVAVLVVFVACSAVVIIVHIIIDVVVFDVIMKGDYFSTIVFYLLLLLLFEFVFIVVVVVVSGAFRDLAETRNRSGENSFTTG